MEKSTLELIKLAGLGTNLVIDASTKSTLDLVRISSSVGLKGTQLRLVNCNSKSMLELMKIVGTYPNNITLDFTNRN